MTGQAQHRSGWLISALTHATIGGTAAFLFAYGETPVLRDTPAILIALSSLQVPDRPQPGSPTTAPATPATPEHSSPAAAPIEPAVVEQTVTSRTVVARHLVQADVQAPVDTLPQEMIHTPARILRNSIETPQPESVVSQTQAAVPLEARQAQETAVVSTETSVTHREAVESVSVSKETTPRPVDAATPSQNEVVDMARPVSVPEERIAKPAPTQRELHADYGWLSSALRERIEQLKRYPSFAKARRLEGRVVVEAEVCETGEIVRLHVAESSGHPRLDDEALRVVRQSSPLPLRHQLGQPFVTIRVPITYQLEG